MTTTFRACYFVAADGQSDIVLTSEEQAHLSDAEMIEAAVAEAQAHCLIGAAPHQVSEADLRDGLVIGDYAM